MNTWKEECVFVLENLGGHAYLKDIYEKFLKIHTRPVTENYRASIRDTLEKGSSESEKFDGTSLFYMVEGKNKGHYGLIKQNKAIFDLTTDDDEFCEGKEMLKQHLIRERNQYLITLAKQKFKMEHNNKLFCILSGIDSNQPPFLVRSHFIANSENGQLCDLSRNLFIVSLTNQFTFCCFFRLQHNPNRDYCICRSCL